MTTKTTTKQKRDSYPYREEYFKKNPGLFECIWFCSQCYKPLFGRKNVVIDHIIPLAKGGRNHISNCTACCRKCNSKKSDIIDGRIVKGYAYKIFESNFFMAKGGIKAGLALITGVTLWIVNSAINLIIQLIFRCTHKSSKTRKKRSSSPIKQLFSSLFSVCGAIVLIVVICYIFKEGVLV